MQFDIRAAPRKKEKTKEMITEFAIKGKDEMLII
jgi:hypothetical protein